MNRSITQVKHMIIPTEVYLLPLWTLGSSHAFRTMQNIYTIPLIHNLLTETLIVVQYVKQCLASENLRQLGLHQRRLYWDSEVVSLHTEEMGQHFFSKWKHWSQCTTLILHHHEDNENSMKTTRSVKVLATYCQFYFCSCLYWITFV